VKERKTSKHIRTNNELNT